MNWLGVGIAVSVISLAAEVLLLLAQESGDAARELSLIRIGLASGAVVAFAIRWPAGAALAALLLFARTGHYFLGGENVLVLLGVLHLVMLTIAVWSAIILLRDGRRLRRSR
jgi:hypothetical protein